MLLVNLPCSQGTFLVNFSETGDATTCTGSDDHGLPEMERVGILLAKSVVVSNVNRSPTSTIMVPENLYHETSKPRSPCMSPFAKFHDKSMGDQR